MWTAAASGLRFGERAGLTMEHVNVERRELRVMQALHDIKGQGPTLGPPKTESAVRTDPVAESSAASLRYLKTAEHRSREIADAIGRRMES